MAHSFSGLGHRPLKAGILSNSELPSEPTSDLGARQALEDYVTHLKNRGMSDRHISDLLVYLEKYCEWLVNTCQQKTLKSTYPSPIISSPIPEPNMPPI